MKRSTAVSKSNGIPMSGLESIPVSVGALPGTPGDRGNALPILHEIRHGLERLADSGEGTLIDLNAIPFGPGDEDRLFALLGHGEVEATVNALGPTRVRETSVSGVWVIDYRNTEEQRLALHIQIAAIPDILRSQPQDIRDAIAILDCRVNAGPGESDLKS